MTVNELMKLLADMDGESRVILNVHIHDIEEGDYWDERDIDCVDTQYRINGKDDVIITSDMW